MRKPVDNLSIAFPIVRSFLDSALAAKTAEVFVLIEVILFTPYNG